MYPGVPPGAHSPIAVTRPKSASLISPDLEISTFVRGNIAVHKPAHTAPAPEVVEAPERGDQLAHDEDRHRMRHRARLDELRQRDVVDVLHHEEGPPGRVMIEVENGDEVRMGELRRPQGFIDQPRDELGIVAPVGAHALDGHRAYEPIRATDGAEEHLGHAADPSGRSIW